MKPWLKRVLTGTALILGLTLMLLSRELTVYLFDILLLVMLFFAVFEVMRATKAKEKGLKLHYAFCYLSAAYIAFFIGNIITPSFGYWVQIAVQLVVLAVFLIYTFFMYYVDQTFVKQCKLKKLKIGKECWRIILGYLKIIGYPSAFIFALFALNRFNTMSPPEINMGLFVLLLVFVIGAMTDTFAFLVGITLKGPKLCPKISPKKTWSGAVGGVFGGMIGALTLMLIYSIPSLTEGVFGAYFYDAGINAIWGVVLFGLIGLVGSVLVQLGDIFASYIKRKYELKDFGKILPGHGGVMDRIDGHMFCAVFIFVTMSIVCFII